jgi:hypothetical protein
VLNNLWAIASPAFVGVGIYRIPFAAIFAAILLITF